MTKNKSSKPIPQLVADLSLLFVAISWGATFVIVKKAIEDLPPFPFLAVRFGLAFLVLIPLIWLYREHLNRIAIGKGLVLGIFLFLGYAAQTVGLQYTTASNAGFITGLCVVMVPLLVAWQQKKAPPRNIVGGVVCATVGLSLLTLGDSFTINYGDPIMLLCAFCFAVQIYLTGRFAPEVNATVLTSCQILTVAVLSGICSVVFPQPQPVFSAYVWFGVILTAVICTSLAFLIQTKMPQFTSPSHTAIIFAAEPVFSAVFAYLLASEVLSARGYFGAALVLAGILIAELSGVKKK